VLNIQHWLATNKAAQEAEAAGRQETQAALDAVDNTELRSQQQQAHIEKLQGWVASNDPVLKPEALRQLERLGIEP